MPFGRGGNKADQFARADLHTLSASDAYFRMHNGKPSADFNRTERTASRTGTESDTTETASFAAAVKGCRGAAVVEPVILCNHLRMTVIAGTVDHGDFLFLRLRLHPHDGTDFRHIFSGADRAERRIHAFRDNRLRQIGASCIPASAAVRAGKQFRHFLDTRVGRNGKLLCRKSDEPPEDQSDQGNHTDGNQHTFHRHHLFRFI